jgi:hypothetical protein
MGNEAELAESSLAELADYDPTVIDSLRQPGSFDQERPGGGVSAGSQGFLSSVKKVGMRPPVLLTFLISTAFSSAEYRPGLVVLAGDAHLPRRRGGLLVV